MKIFNASLCLGLIISVCLSFARFDALCQDLRENVFRLHIIAASDSPADQELKLKVRDEILCCFGELFSECDNVEEAVSLARASDEDYKETAEKVIKENGFDYPVSVCIGESYFENREYDDFTLPAGEYEALNIIIGEGRGKNWWCVMFPAVCIGASGKLSDSAAEQSSRVAENSDNYQIRFKTVEIYEDLKNYFTKRKK